MTYEQELLDLKQKVEERMEQCESDTAYAALVRQLRGINADLREIQQPSGDDVADIIGDVANVR